MTNSLYQTVAKPYGAGTTDAASLATRYLCAAAHLRASMLPDAPGVEEIALIGIRASRRIGIRLGRPVEVGRPFTRTVLRRDSVIDLTYGADTTTIIGHCHLARRQMRARDLALWLIAMATGLLLWVGAAITVQTVSRRSVWRILAPLAVADIAVAIGVGGAWRWVLFAPLAGLLGCWLAFFTDQLLARLRLRRLRSDMAAPRVRLPRLFGLPQVPHDLLARLPDRNVLPYQGDRIVGAGHPESIRTTTSAVDKPQAGKAVEQFQAHQLLDYIANHVRGQGVDHRPTHGIPRLDVGLILAVPASDWPCHEASVPPGVINDCADRPPTGTAKRAYVRAMSTTWDGQVIVSVFVSVALEGRYLRVSVLPHLLPPIVPELRIIDGLEKYHVLAHLGYASVDATRDLRRLAARIGRIGRIGRRDTSARPRKQRKEHKRSELRSLREAYAQGEADHLQQRQDEQRIIDVIQTRVFDVTGRFLTDHGIDTTEFTAQVSVIMQNSVFIAGDVTNSSVQNAQGNNNTSTNTSNPQQGATR